MIVIEPYDPEWPRRFRDLAAKLRGVLGPVALRIDPMEPYRRPLEALGFHYRAGNPELTKRSIRFMLSAGAIPRLPPGIVPHHSGMPGGADHDGYRLAHP